MNSKSEAEIENQFLHHITLGGHFLVLHLKSLTEYRTNLLVGVMSTILLQGAGLASIWVVMRQIPNLNGWSLNELYLLFAILTLSKSLNHMFADNLWILGMVHIRSGSFDRFLTRPINPLFHLLADRFCHDGIGNFLVGSLLLLYAGQQLNLVWSILNITLVAIFILAGGMIFFAINLITATLSFYMTMSLPIMVTIHNLHEFTRYPLTVYGRELSFVLTWLLPFGFASFYPASWLLSKEGGNIVYLSPFVAVVVVSLAYAFWLYGLTHYSSTGS